MKSVKYIIAMTIAGLISTCAFAQEEQAQSEAPAQQTEAPAQQTETAAEKERKLVDSATQVQDMVFSHASIYGEVLVVTRLVDRRVNVAIELLANGVEGSSEDKVEAIAEAVTKALADTVFAPKTTEIIELLRASAKSMKFDGSTGNINIAVQLDMDKDPLHLGIWGFFFGEDMPDDSIIAPDKTIPTTN